MRKQCGGVDDVNSRLSTVAAHLRMHWKKNGCPKDIEFFKFLAITYMIASSENSQQVKAQNIKESFGGSSLETEIFSPVNSYFSLDKQSNYGFLTNWSNWITPSSCNHKIAYSIGVTIDWIDWLIFLKNSIWEYVLKHAFFKANSHPRKHAFFKAKSHFWKPIRTFVRVFVQRFYVSPMPAVPVAFSLIIIRRIKCA